MFTFAKNIPDPDGDPVLHGMRGANVGIGAVLFFMFYSFRFCRGATQIGRGDYQSLALSCVRKFASPRGAVSSALISKSATDPRFLPLIFCPLRPSQSLRSGELLSILRCQARLGI